MPTENNIHIVGYSHRLLRLEDILRSHKFYFKAAKLAIEVEMCGMNCYWDQ